MSDELKRVDHEYDSAKLENSARFNQVEVVNGEAVIPIKHVFYAIQRSILRGTSCKNNEGLYVSYDHLMKDLNIHLNVQLKDV